MNRTLFQVVSCGACRIVLVGAAAAASVSAGAQQPTPNRGSGASGRAANASTPGDPLSAYRALPTRKQAQILRDLSRRTALDPDPLLQDVLSVRRSWSRYPERTTRRAHSAKRWAPGVAPERTPFDSESPPFRAARRRFPPRHPTGMEANHPRALHAEIVFDWSTGEPARLPKRLGYVETFQNYLNGYVPGSDAAIAHALDLVCEPHPLPLASYLEHWYADLNGKAYPGITLYEAWYSGKIIDVPDVDAIPFERQILGTEKFVSPIPGNSERTALYQTIRERAFAFRKRRALWEAAAAAFVCAEPPLDPTYTPLVPRMHYLWAKFREPKELAATWRWATTTDRADFLAKVDGEMQAAPENYATRDARVQSMRALARKIRGLALDSLARFGN